MKPRSVWVIALLFAAYCAISFFPPFEMNAGFWIAFGFGCIAVLSQFYFFNKSFKEGTSARSKFYGYPIARIGVIYLIIQGVLSIGEMALTGMIEPWIFAGVDTVVLVLAALGCISTEVARDEIVRQDTVVSDNTDAMRLMLAQAKGIRDTCKDEAVKPELDKLVSALQYSDPISGESTRYLDDSIKSNLDSLSNAVTQNDAEIAMKLASETLLLVSQRNEACKISKK